MALFAVDVKGKVREGEEKETEDDDLDARDVFNVILPVREKRIL